MSMQLDLVVDLLDLPLSVLEYIRLRQSTHQSRVLEDQTVGFAVSDNTCQDLRLDFFEDENFVTRFEGVGISTEIARSGTPGDPGSFVNLKLTLGVPTPLYYKLVPTNLDSIDVSKRDAEPDETVFGGSKIVIENSVYSGDHSVIRIDDEQFKYQVRKQPESDTYTDPRLVLLHSHI